MALKLYPDLFKKYFGTVVKTNDNKFSALNGAVWSGGSFIYVPKNVKLDKPLQSYFRINNQKTGQFERTLIICDEGSSLHYVEGCTAPLYSEDSLHAAVVEIFVGNNMGNTITNGKRAIKNLPFIHVCKVSIFHQLIPHNRLYTVHLLDNRRAIGDITTTSLA